MKNETKKGDGGMKWENVKLTTICNLKQWKIISQNELNISGYPVYGANGKMGFYKEYNHEDPVLLIGCRGTCGSIHISEPKSYTNGNAMACDNLDSNVNIRYLKYYLEFRGFKDIISGGVQPQITIQNLSRVEIPLPPLPIQQRIAEILDAADALRRKDEELLRKYDELAQAIFIDMFGDPVKNEMGWDRFPFAELFDSRLGKMLDAKKQVGGKKFKYLGNSNLQWFRYNFDNLSEMEFDENEIEKFELKKGDILICEGGEVGRCAIWNNEMPNVYFQKAIHRARVISNNITPEYTVMLFWFLAKFGGLNDYVTAATIAHLTGEKLKTIPIPVPPIGLQEKYRDTVIQLNNQKELFTKSYLCTVNLFNSLLQQAFKGELVN